MDELQPVFPVRQIIESLHNGAIDRLRALASTENQDRVGNRMNFCRYRLEFGPDGIARHNSTLSKIGLCARIRYCSEINPLPEHTVREAGNRILLHDDPRISTQCRGAQQWKRSIASDPDDHIRLELSQDLTSFEDAAQHSDEIAKLADQSQT